MNRLSRIVERVGESWLWFFDFALVLVLLALVNPDILSDKNAFLKDFLDNDLLSTLGFIVALSEASAVNIYMKVSEIERYRGIRAPRSKRAIIFSAYSLIFAFGAAVFLVVAKAAGPNVSGWHIICNVGALLIVYFNLSVIYDLMRASFRVFR